MKAADTIYALGFTAFFAVPFAAYLVLLASGRVELPPAKEKGAGRRIFGPLFIGYYYWMMGPVFRAAELSGLKPNQITFLSAIGAAATSVAIATGHFALASALLIGGSSLDMVDGQLARTKNLATPGGAFLDSTIDRLSDGLIFGGCVIYYAGTPMMYVSLLALVTCYLVSYARARGESLGLHGAEGLAQRADRIVMLGIAMAFSSLVAHRQEGFVPHPHYWVTAGTIGLLAVLNTATAVSRIRWTLRRLAPAPPRVRDVVPLTIVTSPDSARASGGFEHRGRNTA
jgi:CDP-diacylglycerol--glycerol-3-phosphate 3-phosphatidyltransferase/CDP-diacylglycerol--inositol 3-phosphatidyltransferase